MLAFHIAIVPLFLISFRFVRICLKIFKSLIKQLTFVGLDGRHIYSSLDMKYNHKNASYLLVNFKFESKFKY
jgi:hypothetical protein